MEVRKLYFVYKLKRQHDTTVTVKMQNGDNYYFSRTSTMSIRC